MRAHSEFKSRTVDLDGLQLAKYLRMDPTDNFTKTPEKESLKALLLSMPDSQLDSALHPLIEKWSEPEPTSIEILEVLDFAINGGAASTSVVIALQAFYEGALKAESRTHAANLPLATWRNR